jgi:hypothetical protein
MVCKIARVDQAGANSLISMGNSTPLPDAETLSRYSTLATRTARDHLQAAKCLLAAGFWGQAHSIAVIGFEELGKACLGMLAILALLPCLASPACGLARGVSG